MKRLLFVYIFCLFIKSIGIAQEVKASTYSSDTVPDSLNVAVNVNLLIQENLGLKFSQDSLNELLSNKDKEISLLHKKIAEIENRLLFADSIVARLSNDCLRKQYDPKLVSEALLNFSQMYSPELQSKLRPVERLLKDYESYYLEVVAILQSAQDNSDMTIPSIGKQTAEFYITQIKNSKYYKTNYKKNWNIPFLEKLIDKSIKSLQEYDPMSMDGITLIDFK